MSHFERFGEGLFGSDFDGTERTLGGLDVFLPYIYDYVSTFTGKSITTEQWKEHLFSYFEKQGTDKVKALGTVDFDVSPGFSLFRRKLLTILHAIIRPGFTARERHCLFP